MALNSFHNTTQNHWKEDDEQGYTFDLNTNKVIWHKQFVDMIRICEPCFVDVARQMCSECRCVSYPVDLLPHDITMFLSQFCHRFIEFHHIAADKRIAKIQEMRGKEHQRAVLIGKLAKDRCIRRAREFAMVVIASFRAGQVRQSTMFYWRMDLNNDYRMGMVIICVVVVVV